MRRDRQRLVLYRIVFKGYVNDPLRSRKRKNRFHDKDTGLFTSYTGESVETAWAEVLRHLPTADPRQWRVCELRLEIDSDLFVDLTTRKGMQRLGVTRKVLLGSHADCRRIARRLRASGVAAFRTFSSADRPAGRCVVIFLDQAMPTVMSIRALEEVLGG